jgi:hypothetical protein
MNNRNNRATRAIVASGSLVAIIIIGIPWVDEYLRLGRDAAELTELEAQLAENQTYHSNLVRVKSKLNAELDALSARSIDPTRTEQIRESLLQIIRQAGGQPRRIEIDAPSVRPWAVRQDDARRDTPPLYGEESNFVLYKHVVQLQADGSLETVRQIINDVYQQGWLMTTKGLTANPTGVPETPVTLEIQLLLYGLGPNDNASKEEFEDDFANLHMNRTIR